MDEENEGFSDYPTFAHYLMERLGHLKDNGVVRGNSEKTLTVRQLKAASPGDPLSTPNGYTIEVMFGYGKYGRPKDHVDSEKLGKPDIDPDKAIKEDAQDAVTSPEDRLYGLFHIPGSEPTKGIAIFHKYGNISPKTSLYAFLSEKLHHLYQENPDEKTDGLKFAMNTISSKPLVEQLLEDDILGFELTQRKVPAESYAKESDPLGGTRDANFTFTVKADEFSLDKDGINNLISRVQSNDYPFAEIFEDFGEDEYIDSINAIVEGSNENRRKRRLTKSKLTMEEYISTDVDYGDENRPVPASIGKIARELANEQLRGYNCAELDADRSLLEGTDGKETSEEESIINSPNKALQD